MDQRSNEVAGDLDGRDDHMLDLRAVAVGGLFGAGAAVLIDAALTQSSPSLGPTSGALSDAFNAFAAATVGVSLGGALSTFICRLEPWFISGVLGAIFGYLVILTPVFVATRASDVSSGAAVSIALVGLVAAVPAVLIVVAGAVAIRGLASQLSRRHRRTRR